MYSSSNGINPFPQLPAALQLSPAPSFLGLDNDCDINFLPQQHSDLLLSEFLYTDYPLIETTEVPNKAIPTNQETSDHEQLNGNGHCIINPQNLLPRKKDRHSKIYTAQGPRDRRVRLSIDISRKFFDLQDMLGFDKASKTLDWLLTNSKAAIRELMLAKNRSNGGEKSSSSTNSECEMVSPSGTSNEGDDIGGLMGIISSSKKPLMSLSEERKKKQAHKIAFPGIAKESRAKARARARERTREKMCTKRVNGFEEVPPDSSPAHVVNQSVSLSQIEAVDQTQRTVDSHNHNKSTASFIMKNLAKDVLSGPSIPHNWDVVDHTAQLILCYDQHEYLRPANLGEVCNNHSRP